MSTEECPYCGKLFKRLKSHLPHCKLAQAAQTKKNIQTPKELSVSTSEHKTHNKTTSTEKNKVILQEKHTSKGTRKEDKLSVGEKSIHKTDSSLTDIEFKVTSAETLNTNRPKSKWLAKRQKELQRLQQLVPISQKSSNPTSLSEGDKSFREISKGPTQGASQTNGKSTESKKKLKKASLSEQLLITKSRINPPGPLPGEWSLQQEIPKLGTKVNFLEKIESLPSSPSKDFALSAVKEQESLPFITSKTSVWDHIKGSLYYKKSCNLLVRYHTMEIPKVSVFETKAISAAMHQANTYETAASKVSPPLLLSSETSIQRPVEDVLSSRLQSVTRLEWNPEIVTAYSRIVFSTVPLESYCDENMWMKHQFMTPHSKVPLVKRKLGDVRLNELGVWLGTRTPASPREIATSLNQGWQWYYRKYIDVRRGGIGGMSMLIAGYCVLCYIWSYPHLRKERWRKYH